MSELINIYSWMDTFTQSLIERLNEWSDDYIEASLDLRDQNPFDNDWMLVYDAVEKEKQKFPNVAICSASKKIEKIAHDIFVQTMKKTGSDDLAGYVSDDVELISFGLSVKMQNNFLFSLIGSYLSGKIPSNRMERIEYNPTALY